MIINGSMFNADLYDILTELQNQLSLNNIPLLQKFKDSGNDIMVQCPYHGNGNERRPSAGIRKSDGLFHCFACNETHTLNEVISHCFGHHEDLMGSFGWKWLNKNFATVQVEERKDIALDLQRGDKQVNNKSYISEDELDSYRYTHPYMYRRKLTDEIIEIFDVGYDRSSQCITFPVRDVSGNTLFVARRSVNSKFFNYPQNAEKPVYGIYELYQLDKFPSEVIICESMLDALYFWTIGKYAVALNGLGTSYQVSRLMSMPCRKFILCTDSDSAGMQARNKLRQMIKGKLITEYILPSGRKDANDCTKEELKNLQEVF